MKMRILTASVSQSILLNNVCHHKFFHFGGQETSNLSISTTIQISLPFLRNDSWPAEQQVARQRQCHNNTNQFFLSLPMIHDQLNNKHHAVNATSMTTTTTIPTNSLSFFFNTSNVQPRNEHHAFSQKNNCELSNLVFIRRIQVPQRLSYSPCFNPKSTAWLATQPGKCVCTDNAVRPSFTVHPYIM